MSGLNIYVKYTMVVYTHSPGGRNRAQPRHRPVQKEMRIQRKADALASQYTI